MGEEDLPYGTTQLDVYGLNVSMEVTENSNHEIIERNINGFSLNISVAENNLPVPPFDNFGFVIPNSTCIDESMHMLECTCTGLCRLAKKLAGIFPGVWDAADYATALYYCATHNNQNWGSNMVCP